MAIVRLGKMPLRWCTECNLPILELKKCGRCGSPTQKVSVTPPGDVRPAFDFDIEMIRSKLDSQFGFGTGFAAIPDGRVLLMNRCPALDRMDEVVMDGQVIGSLVFDLAIEDFKFIPRMKVAQMIAGSGLLKKGWIEIDKGAVESIGSGASSLAPGILDAHCDILPGDEVIVLGPDRNAIAVGPARMFGPKMLESQRGVGVKSRWYLSKGKGPEVNVQEKMAWEHVLEANRDYLEKMKSKAVDFIQDVVNRKDLPVAVSYSGGKDSLATLLLVLEAKIQPKVLFIDTGLELKETVENVHTVCKAHNLDLLEVHAKDAFWESLPLFGPPARDYRWCCKTCKLGPIARLIKENFPQGVLTFIGQRAYESFQRRGKGAVWKNPWVAQQVGASPIQEWSALLVWLLIFSKGVEVNPLYKAGHARIGCWLCPASDLGDMRLLDGHPDEPRWLGFLEEYAKGSGLSGVWLSKAFWRWRKVPKGLKEYAKHFQRERDPTVTGNGEGSLRLVVAEGYSPCTGGISTEGAFTSPLDTERVRNLLWTIGKVEEIGDIEGAFTVDGNIDVFSEGAVTVRGKDEKAVRRGLDSVRRAVFRAMNCVGCGVCLGRCTSDAITLVDNRAVVHHENCNACGTCNRKCPVTDFVDDPESGPDL